MPINFNLGQFLNPVFIETGLYKGVGIRKALEAGFRSIYSIEVSKQHVARATNVFRGPIRNGRVILIHGNSVEKLPGLLEQLPDACCTFWLDAHFGAGDHPLKHELAIIAEHPRNDHIVLIDDLRMFGKWKLELSEIRELLLQINPEYALSRLCGQIPKDVLAALPPSFLAAGRSICR